MNKKIVVYGVGTMWNNNVSYFDEEEIVAYVDCAPQGRYINGRQVLLPDQIAALEYDYVVIFSKYLVKEICESLVMEYEVPREKILDFFYYLFVVKKGGNVVSVEVKEYLPVLFAEYGISSAVDVDAGLFQLGAYNKESFLFSTKDVRTVRNMDMQIDACMLRKQYHGIMDNLYDNKFDECNTIPRCDIILLIDLFLHFSLREMCDIIEETYAKSEYVYLTLPYCCSLTYNEWEEVDYSRWGRVAKVEFGQMRGVLIRKEVEKEKEDVKIYVVTHKTYKAHEEDLRITIHAGKKQGGSLGYMGDESGDNISHLNAWINECTAMYWIWKNTKHKYVGIEHYRRSFAKNPWVYDDTGLLGMGDIVRYMKNYDVIVARHETDSHYTVKEIFCNSINEDVFNMVYARTRKVIEKKHAQYTNCFDEVFDGYTFYPCNLMVMPKDIYDRYCEWLFSVLFEVMEGLDLSKYDSNSQRAVGFMAERLLTVWLFRQNVRIKELFYVLRE